MPVFISYRHMDRAYAMAINNRLIGIQSVRFVGHQERRFLA